MVNQSKSAKPRLSSKASMQSVEALEPLYFEKLFDQAAAAGRHLAELKQGQGEAQMLKDTLRKERDDRNVETNGLRSIIRDLELTVERHRGYQDGIADAQPPRMVPEERQTRRDGWPYPQVDVGVDVGVRMAVNAPKPWWHK